MSEKGEELTVPEMVTEIYTRMIDGSGIMAGLTARQNTQEDDIAEVKAMALITKKMVHGENGDYKNGLTFKYDRLYDIMLKIDDRESKCPGRDIEAFKRDIVERLEANSDKVGQYLQTIEKVALLKIGEDKGTALAKAKNDIDKQKWWGWFITIIQTYPMRFVISSLLIFILSIVLTWLGVSPKYKDTVKEKIKNGVERTLNKNS